MSTWTLERSRIARLVQAGRAPDDPELIEHRRNYRALRLELYVTTVLAGEPELTDEQRAHIAGLLLTAR